LLKARYDEQTDFLYILRQYNSAHAIKIAENPSYAGFVSYHTQLVYDIGYDLYSTFGTEWGERRSQEAIAEKIREELIIEIQKIVGGKPVPITPAAEQLFREESDRKNHEEYGSQSEALDWFYRRKAKTYIPPMHSYKILTEHIIRFINDHDAFIAEEAQAYINKNARGINLRLWEIGLSQKAYEALEDTPGEHHLRRAIAECLGDAKKVTISLLKEGRQFEGKITTDTLRISNNTYYSGYRLDAADRKQFEKMFGRSASIYARDIERITYGKKILYEKSAVQMPA